MRRTLSILVVLFAAIVSPASATDDLAVLARAYVAAHTGAGAAHSIPSFARQTGLACSACHYQYLTLTPFGRQFKLNGYVLANQAPITENDSTNGGRLGLSPYSMLSAMVTASVTHTSDDLPDTQNDAAELPQELSAFLAGRISPRIGLFAQFTYAGPDGAFGIDNVDIRFANKTSLGGRTDMAYGLTLNNNPGSPGSLELHPGMGVPVYRLRNRAQWCGQPDDRRRPFPERAGNGKLRHVGKPSLRRDHRVPLRVSGRRGSIVGDRGNSWCGPLLAARPAEGMAELEPDDRHVRHAYQPFPRRIEWAA